jgi:hypothetical protein
MIAAHMIHDLSSAGDRPRQQIELARLLIERLERLSADSVWAHRASGARGALLRWVEAAAPATDADRLPDPWSQPDLDQLEFLIHYGFELLENAAKELIE